MIVSKKTMEELAKRREARTLDRMAATDMAWGQKVFTLFYRDYVFRGSIRPTGIIYCLRSADGVCHKHGIVFGPLANAVAELPDPPRSWKIPTKWAPRPIRAFGTCHYNENHRRKSEARGI